MAYTLVTGAEEGIAIAGLATAANRLWSTVAGVPAIDTSVFRSGAKAYRFTAAATRPVLTAPNTSGRTVAYLRAYIRMSDATPSSTWYLFGFNSGTGASSADIYVTTGGVLTASFSGAAGAQSGPTLSDNTWYGIEAELDISANPNVIRWRTWDAGGGWTSRTNVSVAQAAATWNSSASFSMGEIGGPTAGGASAYIDDVLVGFGTTTGEHYDSGNSKGGKVLRYRPTGDGTHTFADGDFKYDNSTNVTNAGVGAAPIYPYLDDDDQTSLADFISQNVAWASGTKALMVTFDNEGTETDVQAVAITTVCHSAGTGANEINVRVSDDGTNWTNVWGDWAGAGVDVSDTTAHILYKVLAAKPSTGAWDATAVNGMRAHFGQSNDVNAIPFYDSISMQVSWREAAAAPTGTFASAHPGGYA